MRLPHPTRVILYFLLIFFAFLTLLPLWSAVMTALKTQEALIYSNPIQPPIKPSLDAFGTAFNELRIPILNSLTFTIPATIISCVLGSMTGYALTKVKFRGANTIFLLVIVGIFIPYQAVLIPLVQIIIELGLYGEISALILTHIAYGVPICTLLFKSFYDSIHDSLINAAKIDGAGIWKTYIHVILPLSVTPFVVAAVFQFTQIWNDLLFGLVLSGAGVNQPASVALLNLQGGFVTAWNVQMAGTLWYTIPALVVYLVLGKYLVKGFMAGAIKG
ncbi:MAG: carbohydrate ABC transporter permease [Candidatus Lokiarchaeota archaeon]|nr:carbohydrate ABC transporter permease [Candidatus Lokiarchaeota archaeon]